MLSMMLCRRYAVVEGLLGGCTLYTWSHNIAPKMTTLDA